MSSAASPFAPSRRESCARELRARYAVRACPLTLARARTTGRVADTRGNLGTPRAPPRDSSPLFARCCGGARCPALPSRGRAFPRCGRGPAGIRRTRHPGSSDTSAQRATRVPRPQMGQCTPRGTLHEAFPQMVCMDWSPWLSPRPQPVPISACYEARYVSLSGAAVTTSPRRPEATSIRRHSRSAPPRSGCGGLTSYALARLFGIGDAFDQLASARWA